jgi:ATP-binding cassette subfamily B protein
MAHPRSRDWLMRLRTVRRTLQEVPRLLWEADARLTVQVSALQISQALVPVAQLWVAKLIIDRLVAALRLVHPLDESRTILLLVALEFALALLGLVLREAIEFERQVLADRLTRYVSMRILVHAQELDLEILERPEFYDRLRRAEESAFYRPAGLLFQSLNVLQGVVTLLAMAALLVRLNPLALPVLLLAALPYAIVHSGAATQMYTLSSSQTPEVRRARYLSHLLSTDVGAKELRVFGLGEYLLGRYRSILVRHERQISAFAWRRSLRSALAGVLPAAAYAGIYVYFTYQALLRHITVGDLTLYAGLILRSQDVLQQTSFSIASIIESSLFFDDYHALLALQPQMRTNREGPRPSLPIHEGIRFEGVTYRYPGSELDALHNVSLEIGAGETVAIVGENGAGKTTLVKLLARLYDPDHGQVTIDGVDLRDLDVAAWREQIAVIFQDFIQYYFTVAENIGFGKIEALDDQARVVAAAGRSGADSVIAQLPRGYRTVLGTWFDQGMQLSGGEWQRLALARAFMRDAPILVLDEPTAALDARSEYEVFQRFRDLTHGKIVLLISHRFSTARMANRIYVINEGRVVETGTHDQLMAREGKYAELFQLQASGYR